MMLVLVISGLTLFGKTIALNFSKVTNTNLITEDWRAKVRNDIAFRLVDI
jgi:hypothetical protein